MQSAPPDTYVWWGVMSISLYRLGLGNGFYSIELVKDLPTHTITLKGKSSEGVNWSSG